MRWLVPILFAVLCAGLTPGRARAEVLQAPIFGRSFSLGEGRIACGPGQGGFVVEAGGRLVRPPTNLEAVGDPVELKVAKSSAECATTDRTLTLVATDRFPTFDVASVVFWPDEGRIEAVGRELAGTTIFWQSGTESGSDVCRAPERTGTLERCVWGTARELSADLAVTTFRFAPRGARAGTDAVMYDALGRRIKPEQLTLVPARIHLTRVAPPEPAIDLATGQGEVPLAHPEALLSAECGALTCELGQGKLLVRGASSLVSSVEVRLRFAPHVFVMRKGAAETQLTVRFNVLHCPMSIVSGQPVRHNDDAKVVVKLEGGCARDLSAVRFVSGDRTLKVLRTVNEAQRTFVLLRLGDFADDEFTLSAVRDAETPIVLAVKHTPTRPAPAVRATLELPGFPNLPFIPINRPATVHTSPAGERERFAILPIPGAYEVVRGPDGGAAVRGDRNAAGLTELRFGLRAEGLPRELADDNLAVLSDPLQRSVLEANVPVPIAASIDSPEPLIEVVCGGGNVPLVKLESGVTAHLPFSLRDTCRVIFHRERLAPEYGTQKLRFEVDVLRADGSPRGEGRVSEVFTLRAGSEPRYAFIRGVADPFDRILVRVSHEPNETHYIGADEIRTGAPAAQWSAVLGTGRVRLYGTTAIPTGLYRFGDKAHSGVLSLNFGVISRLTWVDPEGKEGFIGAEVGLIVIGLANSQSATGESLTQVGAVAGLGVAVPIANRATVTQASINLHAWFEADLTRNDVGASRYAFIFGPSISIGNVGTTF